MSVDGNSNVSNIVMKLFFVEVLMQKVRSVTVKTSKISLVF